MYSRRASFWLAFVLASLMLATPLRSQDFPQDSAQAALVSEIAASLYLGQAYDSGRLYVEGVNRTVTALYRSGIDPAILKEDWPERLRFRGLDPEMLEHGIASGPFAAQLLDVQFAIDPRLVEGMLSIDSPCASDDYNPREGASYLEREDGPPWWDRRDFFVTNEPTYCVGVELIALYEIDQQMQTSFRALAYDADLRISQFDHSYAGTARPMTQQDSLDLAREKERESDCALKPRYVDDAREIVRFQFEGVPFWLRLSSYVAACTIMSEQFIVDVLVGQEVLGQFELSKTRGYP